MMCGEEMVTMGTINTTKKICSNIFCAFIRLHRNYIGTSKNHIRTLNEIEGKMFHLKWLMLFANAVIQTGVVTGLCSEQDVNSKKCLPWISTTLLHAIIFSRVDSERLHDR